MHFYTEKVDDKDSLEKKDSPRKGSIDPEPVVEFKITDEDAENKQEDDSAANSESQEHKETEQASVEEITKMKKVEIIRQESLIKGNSDKINKDVLKMINRFHRKQKRGTIDVWWLFDDGG